MKLRPRLKRVFCKHAWNTVDWVTGAACYSMIVIKECSICGKVKMDKANK